jgi:hypothetical protein
MIAQPEAPFSQAAAKPPFDPLSDSDFPDDLTFLFPVHLPRSSSGGQRLRCAKCGGAMRWAHCSPEQEECVHCESDKHG